MTSVQNFFTTYTHYVHAFDPGILGGKILLLLYTRSMKKADRSLRIVHFLCVNRSPSVRYDFRAGAQAIRYSVNIALCSLICKFVL